MTLRVYFIASAGRIKIGFTSNLDQRLKHWRTNLADDFEYIGSVPGGRELETATHKALRAHRIRTEWFTDCAEVRKYLTALIESPPPVVVSAQRDLPSAPVIGESPAFQQWSGFHRRLDRAITAALSMPSAEDRREAGAAIKRAFDELGKILDSDEWDEADDDLTQILLGVAERHVSDCEAFVRAFAS